MPFWKRAYSYDGPGDSVGQNATKPGARPRSAWAITGAMRRNISSSGSGGSALSAKSQSTWLHSGRGKHSRKPDLARQLIESVIPVPHPSSLFGREALDGWTVWGNRTDVDARVLHRQRSFPMPDPLLTTHDAAAYLHVSPRTLEKWRLQGAGAVPPRKLAHRAAQTQQGH